MMHSDSYHDVFVKGDWNLKTIRNHFGNPPKSLIKVLKRRSCSVDVVKLLLEQGANINCVNCLGYSPLAIALQNSNNDEVIRLLLDRGAKVNKRFKFEETPLLILLKRENCTISLVKLLLDYGAKVNCMDLYGDSPLVMAIRKSKDDKVIQVLVERGAKVNNLRDLHNTPLLVLLREGKSCSVDTVKLLLAKGADINCVDGCVNGCTTLVTALKKSRDEAVIQALLENGANVNIVCRGGETPLSLYLGHRYSADDGCSVGIVKLFLHYEANVNSRNSSGDCPLTTALKNKRGEKIIRMLLEGGADVNTLDGSGKSPLCIAFRHSSNDIVKLLLDAGSSPNACKFHRSALYCSTDFPCSGLREDILKLLLEANADMNNGHWQSVLCHALWKGAKAHDIQLLLNAGALLNTCEQHSLSLICATDGSPDTPLREDVVQLLLNNGASVDDKGLKVLQGALGRCRYETGAIRLLLNIPGMDSFVVANECDESLLHLAVLNPNCRLDAVKILVNRKAQVHSENKRGETALHCALRNRSCDPSVINFLLQNGSLPNTKNKSDETPLALAVKLRCHANIFKELLIAGAHIREVKFFHRSEKFELIEFLVREYQIYDDSAVTKCGSLSSYKMLVKFFLLQNSECDIGHFQRASVVMRGNKCVIEYGIAELSIFVAECLSELQKMDLMQVGNGCTFREFIAGNPEEESYDLGQILKYITENTFPVFLDIIFARVKRLMTKQKYCPDLLTLGRVNLNKDVLCKIATFLSDDDFLRFILAFYNAGKPYESGKTLLGKRKSEPSTKAFKYPKVYH